MYFLLYQLKCLICPPLSDKGASLLRGNSPVIIIVVIITWPSEKPSQKKNSDITVIWASYWFKWANLFKISSMVSQFSTNERTSSVLCCFLFAVFNNC